MIRMPDTLKIMFLGALLGVMMIDLTASAQCDPDITPPEIKVFPQDSNLYTDERCQATLLDYREEVFATDNCTPSDLLQKIQSPTAGTIVELGVTIVTIRVIDEAGNIAQDSFSLSVIGPPLEITLNGDNPMLVSCGGNFTEPGFFAEDVCGGTITELPITYFSPDDPSTERDDVDTSLLGNWTGRYCAEDSTGRQRCVERSIKVEDNESPSLTLNDGIISLQLECKEPYVETGASAFDQCEGDLSDQINISPDYDGQVLDLSPSPYIITYSVRDSNTDNPPTVITREVFVRLPNADLCIVILMKVFQGGFLCPPVQLWTPVMKMFY